MIKIPKYILFRDTEAMFREFIDYYNHVKRITEKYTAYMEANGWGKSRFMRDIEYHSWQLEEFFQKYSVDMGKQSVLFDYEEKQENEKDNEAEA